MRILVWHWGRRGAGPRYAAQLAASLNSLTGAAASLSLSAQAEILTAPDPPPCDLLYPTYTKLPGLFLRLLTAPLQIAPLAARIAALKPDIAICAMPAPLDLLMATALRRARVPFVVMVHDADAHPGDGFPMQMSLQRRLLRRADALAALSAHVASRLRMLGLVGHRPLLMTSHPPLMFGALPPPPMAHGGKLRLLWFGRLRPYKGLDLLADALRLLGPRQDMQLRVVGSGPESAELETLRRLPGVTVENRWVPEHEVGALLAWADALVLSHREASQSGVAAAAVAAHRWIVATRVGGIPQQLATEPLARLCDPTPESLAAELRHLIESPPPTVALPNPQDAWHAAAADLVRQLHAMLDRG